jgi:hypothetical protein
MVSSAIAVVALAIMAVASGELRAANLATLVSFCVAGPPNCSDGLYPQAGVIADANGNLFGTTPYGGAYGRVCPGGCGTVFEIAKTAEGYASTLSTLVSFPPPPPPLPPPPPPPADGYLPVAGLIADANGNLFGTTFDGGMGAFCCGTVFEIAKTADGYASNPTTLVRFCALPNCADGSAPNGSLIADATGNLFGTTAGGGTNDINGGTVFEITKTADGYASTPTTLVRRCASRAGHRPATLPLGPIRRQHCS